MIVLDASVLIAAFDATDAHHARAAAVLQDNAAVGFGCSPLTRAETLVGPARAGRLEEFEGHLHGMGVEEVPLPSDTAHRLARMRASTALRMPDCCVLLAAQDASAWVATFDTALQDAAARLDVAVLSG